MHCCFLSFRFSCLPGLRFLVSCGTQRRLKVRDFGTGYSRTLNLYRGIGEVPARASRDLCECDLEGPVYIKQSKLFDTVPRGAWGVDWEVGLSSHQARPSQPSRYHHPSVPLLCKSSILTSPDPARAFLHPLEPSHFPPCSLWSHGFRG